MAIAGFNPTYYVQTYPDVLVAISQGVFKSAEDHFVRFGAKEGRNPNANFDSKYYLTNNADVLQAVASGAVASAYDHYVNYGYKEGRVPSAALASFNGQAYIDANADVKAAGFDAKSALGHYVLYGASENRGGGTNQQVTGNYAGTTGDDTVTPAGGQTNAVRVEGGQQGAGGDTLVITSGSASSFQVIDLSNVTGDQNRTVDTQNAKVGPVVQGFENVDASAATIGVNITALDRTSVGNTGGAAPTITGSKIVGGTSRDTLTGGNGADSISGGAGDDVISGGAGNDTLDGGIGDDTIDGGAGDDTIITGAGNNVARGGTGNDTITGGLGTNNLDGGEGNDKIEIIADQGTATAVSTISGGAGNDTILLNNAAITAASRVSVSGGAGNDTITAGLGAETINAGAGNDTVVLAVANLGANDVFNGNDGQDFIQLEIPVGSGTNTYTFEPTTRFSGFEGLELIDKSVDAAASAAKSYKIILSDSFLANNLVNGSFLIDARGLPGGSNVVLDFSGLTAASAARFTGNTFRVLASPTTDIRDQNNVTITAAYSVKTGNPLLNDVLAFNVYAGDTIVKAGTRNADGSINTNGQPAYTTVGGTPESASGGTGGGNTFTLTNATAILTNSANVGATPTAGFLTDSGDTINAAAFLSGNTVLQDNSTSDNDVLNAIVTGAVSPVLQNIETINLSSFGAGSLNLVNSTGYNTINLSGTAAVLTGLANGKTVTLNSAGQTVQFDNTGLTNNATNTLAVSLNGIAAGTLTFGTANDTADFDQVTVTSGGSAANSFTFGATKFNNASTDLLTINGTQNLTISSTFANATGNRVNASALATPVFTLAVTDDTAAVADTLALANYVGLDAVNFTNAAGLTGGDTVSGVSNGTFFTLTPTTAPITHGALTFTGTTAAQSGLTDVTGLTLAGTTVGTGGLTFTSFETVNLVSSGSAATTVASVVLTDSVVTETLNVSGSTNLTITSATANVINASALTGTFTLGGTTASTIITGSATAANNITGSGVADTIIGGAANDTLVGGAGADVLTGGAGNDVFVFASRAVTQAGFAATDQTTANIDKITDFAGNGSAAGDVIQLGVAANVFGAALQFTTATTATVTAVTVATAADFTALAAAIQTASAGVASTNTVAQVYDVTVSAGNLAGRFLVVNDDTAGIAATDTYISINGITGTLHASDFTFA